MTLEQLTPINWRMAAHPLNWLTVVLMLVIAGAIGAYVLKLAGLEPATTPKSAYGSISSGQIPADPAINAINPQSAGYVQ